jgi:hypothetical protein
MRKKVRMTFIKGVNRKGYMGHWGMDYYVDNVIDLETNELICSEYIFRQSTIFKGKGFKTGDIIEMSINVNQDGRKVKLSYYADIKKVG